MTAFSRQKANTHPPHELEPPPLLPGLWPQLPQALPVHQGKSPVVHTLHARRHRKPAAPPWALKVCVLATGSSGNTTVVRTPHGCLLIDCGLTPKRTAYRLMQAGLGIEDLRAIVLTHLDRDHFKPSWLRVCADLGIRLHCHAWHVNELRQCRHAPLIEDAGMLVTFDDAPFTPFPQAGDLTVRTTRLQHDRQGTIGYRIDAGRASLGYATDLGHAPDRLIDLFRGVDAVCLEANYDERMTTLSSRPSFVNRRNLSDSGHLSNEQALDAVQRIVARSAHPPRHVVLMHRSQQCNHPTKLRRVFEQDPFIHKRTILAEQRKRTRWLTIKPTANTKRQQLPLSFGLAAGIT